MENVIPTEVIEVMDVIDYTPLLDQLIANSELCVELLQIIGAGAVCVMVALLCCFVYKFFRIFF